MKYIDKVKNAQELIKYSIDLYGLDKISVGFSGGKDSCVLLDLALKANHKIKVFSILADTEFQETYDLINELVKKYELDYKEYIFVQKDNTDPLLCCGQNKVDSTKDALKDMCAWFSGIRRDEGITRVNFERMEVKDGLMKINPILDFTELDIWRYIATNNVPVNKKYKDGYRSLGCERCSFLEEDETETERAGRWKGTDREGKECGIHTKSLR